MRETYLVTGATGFIGTNLVKYLVSKNKRVVVLTRQKKLNIWLSQLKGSIGVYQCDLLDKKLPKVIDEIKPDYIFHLASEKLAKTEEIKSIYEANFLGTVLLIEALKQNKFKLFVNSACSESLDNYKISKDAAALYCKRESVLNNLPIITFRISNVYGYFDNPESLIVRMIANRIHKKLEIKLEEKSSNYIFVEDVLEEFNKCIDRVFDRGTVIDIKGGEKISEKDLSSEFEKILQSKKNPDEKNNMKAKVGRTPFSVGLLKTYKWIVENKSFYKIK